MTFLAATAAGLGVALLVGRPPAPQRVLELRPVHRRVGATRPSGVEAWVAGVGRAVRRHVLRRSHADWSGDRRVGAATVLVALALIVDPVVAALVGATAVLVGRWRRVRRRSARSRLGTLEDDLPELVDLVALTVAAGLTVPESLRAAEPCAPSSLRPDLTEATAAIARGARIEGALLQLGRRWGEPGRPLVHALVDHTRYGTPLLPSLERVGAEARTRRRRAAEIRARRLPVLLLFPLVLCTLPAFGLLTVAPLIAGTLGSLDGSPLEAPASTAP